ALVHREAWRCRSSDQRTETGKIKKDNCLPYTAGYLFRATGNFFLIIAQQFTLLKIQKSILLIFLFIGGAACSQRARFSLSTDVGALHSFKKDQRFWCAAQTINGNFSFTQKDGLYVWFYYTINGKFSNDLTANAKSVFTVPLQVNYTNDANLRFSHISTGW